MKITIGGTSVEHRKVTYRGLGFGQTTECDTIRFQLEVSTDEFRTAIQRPFDEFVEESKMDDKETSGSAAIPELVRSGYPSFEELLSANEHDLCSVVKDCLFFELLDGLLGGSVAAECRFAVNSLDAITCGGEGGFVITGTAYSIN